MRANFRPGRSNALAAVLAIAGLAAPSGPGVAYAPEEVGAILVSRPDTPGDRSLTLAHQRRIVLNPGGMIQVEDHLLRVVGASDVAASEENRWTFRPDVETMTLAEGTIHRAGGSPEALPPGAAGVEVCAAAGPEGYPGIADFVVRVEGGRPGDVIELKVLGRKLYYISAEQCFGEHRFASGDSIVETELVLDVPAGVSFHPRRIGALPDARIGVREGLLEGRWLTGRIPPSAPTSRSVLSQTTTTAPDSAEVGAAGALWYGFDGSWEGLAASRRGFWRRALSEVPLELSEVKSRLLATSEGDGDPVSEALRWVEERLAPLDLAAARLWYEPAPLSAILERRAALPRDRALVVVWLLRQLGLRADAGMVASRPTALDAQAVPQQLDTWVVRWETADHAARWIDLRPAGGARVPLPPGRALLWTGDPESEVLVPFDGTPPSVAPAVPAGPR